MLEIKQNKLFVVVDYFTTPKALTNLDKLNIIVKCYLAV